MMMTIMIMRCNIYTVSGVSVSKHYVKHGSFSDAFGCFWNLRTYDFDAMSSPFEVCHLLSQRREDHWYSANHVSRHVITDVTANHRLSLRTVRILPVRGSQFAKYPHLQL